MQTFHAASKNGNAVVVIITRLPSESEQIDKEVFSILRVHPIFSMYMLSF